MQRDFRVGRFSLAKKQYTSALWITSRWRNRRIKYALYREDQYFTEANALQVERRLGILAHTFELDDLSDELSVKRFRFHKADIRRLRNLIPWNSSENGRLQTLHRRYKVVPVEALYIMMRRLSMPSTWSEVEAQFGRQQSALSELFYRTLNLFYNTFPDLIRTTRNDIFVRRAQLYSEAFVSKGCPLLKWVGMIDGTNLRIARPGGLRQRASYSGHKRFHCPKFQAVVTPDGLIAHFYGPVEGRRHDITMFRESGLATDLCQVLNIHGVQHYIYGDSAYVLRPYMIVGFKGASLSEEQIDFNSKMSTLRIFVEHAFKDVKMYFTHIDLVRKGKTKSTPFAL